jgi:hypothetical protein
MGDFDPPYDTLSDALKETIRRTHREKSVKNANFAWQLGFVGTENKMTIPELLAAMDKRGDLAVLKDVEHRCSLKLKGLWGKIRAVLGVWDYTAGHMVSEGFNFTCDDPDAMETSVGASTSFCKDKVNVHGPRNCYREIITAGPGLHVCITEKASRGDANPLDIHIDRFQAVCTRQSDGFCDTALITTNTLMHLKDSIPWWLGVQKDKLLEGGKMTLKDYKPALKPGEPKL